jgi:hypothetical protein
MAIYCEKEIIEKKLKSEAIIFRDQVLTWHHRFNGIVHEKKLYWISLFLAGNSSKSTGMGAKGQHIGRSKKFLFCRRIVVQIV